ncbi:DUF2786 domain-containing protein [Arthrobacter sulfonylureivorans]|uniref:DUF2786 domain-containing protein n=1 Tax=Arthrobacter sulfonylureivorans TaxID=2486855 RepID=UPI0039E494C4
MARITKDKAAKTLELINQLLAKAENTPYPAEAQAFQEHAERLMVRYGIEKAQLDDAAGKAGKEREAIVERQYVVSGVYRAGLVRGFTAVAHAFNAIEIMESTWRERTTLYLIGAESDVTKIIRLFDSLLVQIQPAMAEWWKNTPERSWMTRPEKEAERRQFQMSFLYEVSSRLLAIYGEESTGQELVLADRKSRASEKAYELYPNAKQKRQARLQGGSYAAGRAGRAAGRNADVGTGKMGAASREAVNA